jgi:2-methylaconitate cis-trans-isomerase PrpF
VGPPSGRLEVESRIELDESQHIQVMSAIVGRIARVLMEGEAFILE